MKIEEEIEIINDIIFQAIIHGGDNGGPYGSNKVNLIKVIKNWLKQKGLFSYYTINESSTRHNNGIIYSDIIQIEKIDNLENKCKKVCFRKDFANNWKKGDIVPVKLTENSEGLLVDGVTVIAADELFQVAEIVDETPLKDKKEI